MIDVYFFCWVTCDHQIICFWVCPFLHYNLSDSVVNRYDFILTCFLGFVDGLHILIPVWINRLKLLILIVHNQILFESFSKRLIWQLYSIHFKALDILNGIIIYRELIKNFQCCGVNFIHLLLRFVCPVVYLLIRHHEHYFLFKVLLINLCFICFTIQIK